MLPPTFRFAALPLAAVLALTALSMQPASSKTAREEAFVREAFTDCSTLHPGEVCVIDRAGS